MFVSAPSYPPISLAILPSSISSLHFFLLLPTFFRLQFIMYIILLIFTCFYLFFLPSRLSFLFIIAVSIFLRPTYFAYVIKLRYCAIETISHSTSLTIIRRFLIIIFFLKILGKGENIWDYMTHTTPDAITDSSNGDIACLTYYNTEGDVQLLSGLGVNFYRFSLSWSRLLPSGYTNYTNPDGVRYYRELITELIENGITPLVTIFHWDLPQPLQEIGGWPNPLLADLFQDYADIAFSLFGGQVKNWITFNEPYQICQEGYSLRYKAPGYTQDGIGGYLCAYTLLLAHANAYHLYANNYKEVQQGKCVDNTRTLKRIYKFLLFLHI